MQIIIEDSPPGQEDQIIIRASKLDPEIMDLIQAIKSKKRSFLGYSADLIQPIPADSVYYFEAVDNKVFLYCEKQVFEVKEKLYKIEQEMTEGNFFRISKSVILNIRKIARLRPALSGRLEAELDNQEKVIISRQYVPALKKKLGI